MYLEGGRLRAGMWDCRLVRGGDGGLLLAREGRQRLVSMTTKR